MGAELHEESDARVAQVVRCYTGEIGTLGGGCEMPGTEVALAAGPAGALWPDERVAFSRSAQEAEVAGERAG